MFEEIKAILLEQFDVLPEEISLDSNIVEDFKADSLDLIELSSFIEEKFEIKLEKNDIKNVVNVNDLINLINKKRIL